MPDTEFKSLQPDTRQAQTKLDKDILKAREEQEKREALELQTFVPFDSTQINKSVEKLYSVIFVEQNVLDFETLPTNELVEKYLKTGSMKALFLDWSRRCVPGDMTAIGNYYVVRKSEA
jgi:hypothetical protein